MVKFISGLLVFFGLITSIIGGYKVWEINNPKRLNFESFISPNIEANHFNINETSTHLVSLVIPTLSIDLPILPAQIKNNVWESTKNGVSYLSSSAIPGEVGNSIFYGHDFPNLLGRLPQIKPGNEIYVTYANGVSKRFVVATTQIVTSMDSSVLNPSTDKRLTIYTCTGFFDSKRFVAVALLTS